MIKHAIVIVVLLWMFAMPAALIAIIVDTIKDTNLLATEAGAKPQWINFYWGFSLSELGFTNEKSLMFITIILEHRRAD